VDGADPGADVDYRQAADLTVPAEAVDQESRRRVGTVATIVLEVAPSRPLAELVADRTRATRSADRPTAGLGGTTGRAGRLGQARTSWCMNRT
jgi:hypothetical protein